MANLLERSQKHGQSGPLPVSGGAGLDEFETLTREKAYLADAFSVPVAIFSAYEAGEEPKGKSRQAETERPAIYIENA